MTDLVELEHEAQAKVSKSISSIEVAIARWENSEDKPERLKERIEYLRLSHRLFSGWAKKSIKGKKDIPSVVARLDEFSRICKHLDAKRPWHGRTA